MEIDVALRHWRQLARKLRKSEELIVDTLMEMGARLPDEMYGVLRRCRQNGLKAPILDKVLDAVAARCADQRKLWQLDPVGQDES